MKTSGILISNKEYLPPIDETQDHNMKLIQKRIVCNSLNSKNMQPTITQKISETNSSFDVK